MKKYLRRVTYWMASVSALFLVSSLAHRPEGDPAADFIFSLFAPASASGYTMSESLVSRVLSERLDVFPKSQVSRLTRHLMSLCEQYHFDPALVLSVVQVESSFRIRAKSSVGALGLMQIMPGTAQYVARRHGIRYTGERSLLDPYTNLSLGVAYLSMLREKYRSQSPYFQFAAYNMGPAKLEQLRRARGRAFKGAGTKEYYEAIRRNVPVLRAYPTMSSRLGV